MLVKQIMMPILILAIIFSLSYWILISSEDKDVVLKSIGKILGGSIIILGIIATSMSYYFLTECYFCNRYYSNYIQVPVMKQIYHRHGYRGPHYMENKQLPPTKALKTTKAK